MKKTFSAFLLALACVSAFAIASHVRTFYKPKTLSFALRPALEESEQPHPLVKAVFARGSHPSAQANRRERIATKLISASAVFEPAPNNTKNGPQFVGRANGMVAALTSTGILVQVRPESNVEPARDTLGIRVKNAGPFRWHGQNKAQGESNYFVGNDPRTWRTHVARFNRVETADSDGVGLALYGKAQTDSSGQGIEYDLRLDAGVDPAKVRLQLTGAHDIRVDHNGDLTMHVGGGELRMRAPAIYEQVSTFHAAAQRRRKTTSSPRSRKITSPHSKPRGSRGTRPPRVSSRGSSNAEHRRVRRAVHEGSHSRRKKRPKKIPFPLGEDSVKSASPRSKPQTSSPRESGRRIEGGYILEADGSIGFWVAKHDSNAALVIDPSITVTYATFLGGAGSDSITGMAMDTSGNVYVAGTTNSAASFPEAANGIEGNIRGTAQLFLAKVSFSATGTGTLQYLTFFGGSNAQAGAEVAVDANGNAAVLGTTTSADYPVTDGRAPTQGLMGGTGNDLAVSEVDATGSNLLFSTIFGGNGTESANAASGIALTSSLNIPAGQGGVAFDVAGDIYVASDTTSTDLPTSDGAYQPAFGGKASSDGFIAEFQTQNVAQGANDLLYCSYLGTNSDGQVAIGGVAVDAATPPNVYVAGTTLNSIDGFPTQAAVQTAYGGGTSDAFLMKLVAAGTGTSDLVYATLLGGSGMDEALGVTVDSQTPPNAYVVGATQSPAFPENPVIAGPSTKLYEPSPPPGVPSVQNAFLAVVGWNPAARASSLQYLTYLGGSNQDAAQAIAAPFPNSVYVSGTTTSSSFGWHDNVQPFNGAADAFLVKLDTTQAGAASLKFATPLAGTFIVPDANVTALGNAVAADGRGNVYVAGETTAVNFPTVLTSSGMVNGFQQTCGSCQVSPAQSDAFLAGLQESDAARPALSFSVGKLSFGATGVQIGTAAVPQPFAIINTGEAALNLSTNPPTVAGANGGDFSITIASGAGCPQPLQPGQVCQAEVNFVPSVAGLEGGVVSVADDAPGSPQLLEVTGTGVGPLTVSPASFAFGTVPLGQAPTKHDIKVTITAGNQVNSLAFILSGPNTAQFTWMPLGTACFSGIKLESGTSCDIWYAFTPATTGSFQAELDVTCSVVNGTPITEKLPLTGTAVEAVPVPITAPTQLIFRSEQSGSSETLPVLISNTGTAPLQLTQQGIGFSGANASDFSQTNTCPTSIAPNSSCTVYVQFAPQSAGGKTASLTISDDAPGSPQLVALSGTGIAPPQAQVTPANWDFGSQNVGAQSSPEAFSIANNGNTSLNFTQAIAIAGANAADFQQTNNCPVSLAPGSSCSISVVFSPQSAGARAAGINIANNAPGSPQSVPLTGTGVLLAQAQISPANLSFGSQVIETSSAPQSVSVKNTGSAPLIFDQIAFAGANPGDFVESDNCLGNDIAPNLSCTIFLRFAPQSVGAKTASLTISDNAADSPQAVTLSGTGSQPASIEVTPSTLSFGTPQSVGTISQPYPISIANEGAATITFTAGAGTIAIGGSDSSDFSETSNCSLQSGLQPNSACTVNVVFAPTSGGTRTATLSIFDNAPGSPQIVALSGVGVQAGAQVAPAALSFGGQSVGATSAAQTITVTSVGPGQPLNVSKVSFSGANAADFAETDTCGGPITASCAISVTFTPVCANESALRTATLTIQDNGSAPSQTVSLTGTASGDFCLSASPDSLIETVAAGTTAIFPPSAASPISIVSVGSFSGTVNLTCSSSPIGPACSFSPSAAIAVSPNLPAQFEVQAATSVSSSGTQLIWPGAGTWGARLLWVGIALMALIAVTRARDRRAYRFALAGAMFAAFCLGFAACGGGGGAGPNVSSDPPPPLAGAYTLTVTATGGAEPQTLSLHLNVTP